MEKGYFFSLEALIAALILVGSIALVQNGALMHSDKEKKIYETLDFLEASGSLESMQDYELERNLTNTLGFEVKVNPPSITGSFIKYLVVEDSGNFRVIHIAYQLP